MSTLNKCALRVKWNNIQHQKSENSVIFDSMDEPTG
jgi:hypothetical protein